MLIRGYIDESANTKFFTLSCLLDIPMNWKWIESKWKAVLRSKNKELRRQNRQEISRYHATDCANCKREFSDWQVDEQVEFSKKLIAILKSYATSVMAYSVPLDDFVAVFPEYEGNARQHMHAWLLKLIMYQIIEDIEEQRRRSGFLLKPYSIALVHDRTENGGHMLTAFNQLLEDVNFVGREHFISITSAGWEDCIPLQAADMIAYESFRDAFGQMSGKPRRKSLLSLLSPDGTFGGRSRTFHRAALELLKANIGDNKAKRKSMGP